MRKKLLTTICTLAMALAFCACGETEDAGKNDVTGTPAVEKENAGKDDKEVTGETEDADKSSEGEADVNKEDETKEEVKATQGPLYYSEVEYTVEGVTFKIPHSYRDLEAMGWGGSSEKTLAPGTIWDYVAVKSPYSAGLYLMIGNHGTEEIAIQDGDVVGVSVDATREMKLGKQVPEVEFMGVHLGDSREEMLATLGDDYIEAIDHGYGMYDYTYDLGNGTTLGIAIFEDYGGVTRLTIYNCDEIEW